MENINKSLKEKLLQLLNTNEVDDFFIDCGQGDKFIIEDCEYNENGKSISFKINKHSVIWIEMDGKHPVKLSVDKCGM